VILANALMRDILQQQGLATHPDERDGLQSDCELAVRRTASEVADIKADLL